MIDAEGENWVETEEDEKNVCQRKKEAFLLFSNWQKWQPHGSQVEI